GLEAFDHVTVVYDLVAHIDRRAVAGERLLDRVDGAHDPGAKAARRAQEHLQRGLWVGSKGLGHRHYGPRLRPSLAPFDMALCPSSVKRRAGPKFPAERNPAASRRPRSLRPAEPRLVARVQLRRVRGAVAMDDRRARAAGGAAAGGHVAVSLRMA